MKTLLSKIKASMNALYFHSASLGLLYISWFYSVSVHRTGFFYLHGEQKYLAWIDGLPIRFLSNTSLILLVLQFILLIVTILGIRTQKAAKEKNVFIESTIVSFSVMNLVLFIMLIAAMNLYFIKDKFDLLFFPISSFIASFFIWYFILKESDEVVSNNQPTLKKYFSKKIEDLSKFDFPFYKTIGMSSFLLGFYLIINFNRRIMLNIYIVFIGASIALVGAIYLLAGSYFCFKQKDELQRQIILEQNLIRNRFIYGILFVVFLLRVTFQIRLDNILTIFVLVPIMLISEAFIKDKYE